MNALLLSLLLAAQATGSTEAVPLGTIPKQQLPARGCAAYLWSAGDTHTLVAMASADPAQLRLSLDGKVIDLPRTAQHGEGGLGLAGSTEYAAGPATATLDLTVATREDLKDGAAIPQATLRLDRTGQDSVVMPVAGLIGCAPATVQ